MKNYVRFLVAFSLTILLSVLIYIFTIGLDSFFNNSIFYTISIIAYYLVSFIFWIWIEKFFMILVSLIKRIKIQRYIFYPFYISFNKFSIDFSLLELMHHKSTYDVSKITSEIELTSFIKQLNKINVLVNILETTCFSILLVGNFLFKEPILLFFCVMFVLRKLVQLYLDNKDEKKYDSFFINELIYCPNKNIFLVNHFIKTLEMEWKENKYNYYQFHYLNLLSIYMYKNDEYINNDFQKLINHNILNAISVYEVDILTRVAIFDFIDTSVILSKKEKFKNNKEILDIMHTYINNDWGVPIPSNVIKRYENLCSYVKGEENLAFNKSYQKYYKG